MVNPSSSKNDMMKELKATSLAKALTDDQLARIAEHCQKEFHPAGQQLCAADDILNKLYIIVEGCLKAVVPARGRERSKGFFNAGEVLGQYSLLFNESALADIYAEFDTTVLTVDRPTFLELIESMPELRQLLGQAFRTRIKSALHEEKTYRFARSIMFVRSSTGSTRIPMDIAERLGQRGERVAYVGEEKVNSSHVTQLSIDPEQPVNAQLASLEFDRVIIESEAEATAELFELIRFANQVFWCFWANDPVDMQKLVDQAFEKSATDGAKIRRICLLEPGQLYAPPGLADVRLHRRDFIMPATDVASDSRLYRQGICRLTRHLCDVKLGLALAGGGARGLVHFGVLRAFDRAGISFDMMGGTSAGAMFGLSYATGLDTEFMLDAYHRSLTPGWPFSWLPNGDRWFLIWKYRTRGWDKMLRSFFSCDFDQLQIPFSAVSADLVQGKQVVRESGDIIHAMLESLNLPVIAKPILKDGLALVDGGVLNNLPARTLAEKGADYVVGVNVSDELSEQFGKNRPGMATSEMRNVGAMETVLRVLEVIGKGSSDSQKSAADLLLKPDTSAFSFTDFTQGAGLAEVGEAVAEQALPELQENIDRLMRFERTR